MTTPIATAVETLTIVLQHDIDEQYQYQPGEIIRGNIVVRLKQPSAAKGITIKVYGEGSVSWKDENEAVIQAQETYVDAMKAVVDTTNLEPLSLTAGLHEFPFDYVLPDNVPSSYIGKYGNVTYTMKATISGVKPADNAISSEPFLVLRRSPIPALAQQSLTMESEKRMWASCTFGKVYIRVSMDKSGGVPGEDVFLQAEIKNHSKRTITAMQASLVMISTFRAQHRATSFRQIVSKKRDEFDVTYGEGRRWTFVRLTLPPYIPESKLECCDIIELDYLFQFRIELSGGSEVRLEAPFWIGAQPQGLEIPENEKIGHKISRTWTVRGSQAIPGFDQINLEDKPDYDDGWGVELVPELRPTSQEIANPLFNQNAHIAKGVKVIPDELFENTKL